MIKQRLNLTVKPNTPTTNEESPMSPLAYLKCIPPDEKKPINHADIFGNTELMLAANKGQTEHCKELLDSGANVNLQDKYGQTALIFASFNGHVDVVSLLLKCNADPNLQTHFGQTALMKVAFSNSHAIAVELIKSGANVSLQSEDGRTALHIAAQCNNVAIVKYLVEHAGADINCVTKKSQTPVMLAAEKGCMLVVEFLVRCGANINLRDSEGRNIYEMVENSASSNGGKEGRVVIEAFIKDILQSIEEEKHSHHRSPTMSTEHDEITEKARLQTFLLNSAQASAQSNGM